MMKDVPTRFDSEIESGNRFKFGENWQSFLSCLSEEQVADAQVSIAEMLSVDRLDDKRVLDVGSGSGLSSLAFRQLGATVTSFDYDPSSVACTRELRARYFPNDKSWKVCPGSVLDEDFLKSLGRFDIVYSWGVLHHTGRMWKAIENAAGLVGEGGILFIAIYNESRTSPVWKRIKRLYVRSGSLTQSVLVAAVYVAGAVAKAVYTRSNPFEKERGMNFSHDIVDWVGGHPYEYASIDQVTSFVEDLGFKVLQVKPGATPIACNEFVFRRASRT